jgi:hypothetical protein
LKALSNNGSLVIDTRMGKVKGNFGLEIKMTKK